MSATSESTENLCPGGENLTSILPRWLLKMLVCSQKAAAFVADELFLNRIRNQHTRAAYLIAVNRFLVWAEARGLELVKVTPQDIGQYMIWLRTENMSVGTRRQHLSALRHLFDGLVIRHAMINPALSVRGEPYEVVEAKTPQVTMAGARQLLAAIDTTSAVGLRDRAIVALLIYTACRTGAITKLKRRSFYFAGDQWLLHFANGAKSREIPVCPELAQTLFVYMAAAGLGDAEKDSPLFRTACGRTGRLTTNALHIVDVCRIVKRHLKDAGLPSGVSSHSFRVTTIAHLLDQGVPLADVQRLAGHSDPRTTRQYDRHR